MTDFLIAKEFFTHLNAMIFEINKAMVGQLVLFGPEHAGRANKIPWSGHWWPMNDASNPNLYDANGPLEKYDDFVKKSGSQSQAVTWEKSNHYRAADSTAVDAWWAGHCNGVAAAGILEPEPTQAMVKNGISFSVADLKGLMTEYHWFDSYILNEVIGTDAAKFHKLVITWMGKSKLAVVMDVQLGKEIFNHAAAAYHMTYQKDANDPSITHVTSTIFFVGYAAPDFVGTEGYPSHFGKTYTYWLKDDIANPSTGGWEGASLSDHPDAIWRPFPSKSGLRGPFGQGLPSELVEILS